MKSQGSKDPEADRKAAAADATMNPEPDARPPSRGPGVRARLRLYYADRSTSALGDVPRMLHEMQSLEGQIACFRPMSFLGVRKLLSMATDILAERIRGRESILGDASSLLPSYTG